MRIKAFMAKAVVLNNCAPIKGNTSTMFNFARCLTNNLWCPIFCHNQVFSQGMQSVVVVCDFCVCCLALVASLLAHLPCLAHMLLCLVVVFLWQRQHTKLHQHRVLLNSLCALQEVLLCIVWLSTNNKHPTPEQAATTQLSITTQTQFQHVSPQQHTASARHVTLNVCVCIIITSTLPNHCNKQSQTTKHEWGQVSLQQEQENGCHTPMTSVPHTTMVFSVFGKSTTTHSIIKMVINPLTRHIAQQTLQLTQNCAALDQWPCWHQHNVVVLWNGVTWCVC